MSCRIRRAVRREYRVSEALKDSAFLLRHAEMIALFEVGRLVTSSLELGNSSRDALLC